MNIFNVITVEPSIFVFQMVSDCINDLNNNLFLQKSCRFDRTHEPDLTTKCDDEKQGVLFVSEFYLRFTGIIFLLNGIFSIIAMPWSDKAGRRRRPFIFIPIFSTIVLSLLGCLHSYFWRWTPFAAVLSVTFFSAISGGPFLMIPACQVYICDIYDAGSLTARTGLMGVFQMAGLILGRGGSGFVLRKFGFFYSYLLCFALSTFGLILALIFIKDRSIEVEKKLPFNRMFSNIGHDLVDNFSVVFRKSFKSKRIVVLLLLVINFVANLTYFGEVSVLYQYLRYRFGWTEQTYSQLMFYKFSSSACGVLFCSAVLSKYFKWHDGLIGMLAASIDIIAILWLLFATQAWQIFLLPFIDVFHGTVMNVTIPFMSKYYHPNELGRLNAVISIFSLPMAVSYPIYNAIYSHTLDTFPTAFCLPSIVLDVGILLGFCWAYILSKKIDSSEHAEKAASLPPANFQEGDDLEVTVTTTTPLAVSRWGTKS